MLPKGKGVKLINIPGPRHKAGEEKLVGVAVFREGDALRLYAGKQNMRLKPSDIDTFAGSRAQRGRALPRGYQRPTAIETITA